MTAKMKRREFITLLGGAAVWLLGARAQQRPAAVTAIGTHRRFNDVRSYLGSWG